ncbi:hypothetical protein HHI36_004441 [Cryptolaemus montrouzieri]|uniref:DUF4774 domain-containing protein n=1 Tax=Cryptolaemus montrouzieri TaxID=559131 RepID=A0ABD2NR72_9CUCU
MIKEIPIPQEHNFSIISKLLLLINAFLQAFFLTSVYSKPQNYQFHQSSPNVEVVPQDILHIQSFNVSIEDESSQKKIEENTKEILQKIEALNKKQGLTKKKKPSYFHFPFSYSRSQEDKGKLSTNYDNQEYPFGKKMVSQNDSLDNFKFPTNPFQNPIFQYLENQQNIPSQEKSSYVPFPTGGMTVIRTNPNAEITEEDEIPGQYVKRKITHQQTVVVPSVQTYINNPYNPLFQQYMQTNYGYENPNPMAFLNQYITNNPAPNQKQSNEKQNSIGEIEANPGKQTTNSVKNVIFNPQPNSMYLNPYAQPNYQSFFPMPSSMNPNQNYENSNYQSQSPAYVYGPYVIPNLNAASRQFQFQSPLQDYFPMVIKDPFVQLFNAFTSMIEYGPQATAGAMDGGCKRKDTNINDEKADENKKMKREEENLPELRTPEETFTYITDNSTDVRERLMLKNSTESGNLIIEIFGLNDNSNISSKSERSPKGKSQKAKNTTETSTKPEGDSKSPKLSSSYNIKENHVELTRPQYVRIHHTTPKTVDRDRINSPPSRFHEPYDDEKEDPKKIGFGNSLPSAYTSGEDLQVSHDGNKKLFSKDNTGSGIFIHKLKVRRGGVAIAGPGGIATAGDGGTAIVGPNGYAYTQPDSLAIAGTGTKVIAVEPTINLTDLVKNNKTRLGPNAERVGKLVAVGPVIYYNKG